MSAITSPQDSLATEPAAKEPDAWWASLHHSGLLLSAAEVARLTRDLPPQPLSWWASDKLRRQRTRFDAGDLPRNEFVAWVLEEICELRGTATGRWLRGAAVGPGYTKALMDGNARRPTHVWKGEHGGEFPVFVDAASPTLGVGRGRKTLGDAVQWLRLAGLPFALLTNARQWRLVYAGIDFEAACEWDIDLWYEDGQPGTQLEALRMLLSPALLDATPGPDDAPSEAGAAVVADGATAYGDATAARQKTSRESLLLAAVRASRRGQSELSAMLGERVREAVEHLVRAHGAVQSAEALNASGADIYRAAVRVVMRMVFVLFAESRGLLPRDNPIYESSYSLQGLVHQLEKVAHRGRGRLAHGYSAWPRVLALFRLVFEGSWHEAMQLPAYGGELFAPGRANDGDAVSRALHVFETACFESGEDLVPDSVVYDLLDRLTRTKVRIRQGRSFKKTTAPVDFSDLSSEYIGILYEGLLDYELRTAGDGDPVIFLGIGNEPALPLSRLQEMDDKQIANLFEKLKETKSDDDSEDDAEDAAAVDAEEAATAEESEDADEADGGEDESAEAEDELSAQDTARNQANTWARRACVAAKLVRKLPAGASPDKVARHERELADKVRSLVRRVVLPGQWYLVRWGGTRKGSGTFYTRPGLAVPTVHRTLRPLAYQAPVGADGAPQIDAPPSAWQARRPEEILALKVCDPGCGSGSFLSASLRFLTDAVYASLFEHDRLKDDWQRPLDELLGLRGAGTAGDLEAERLPCPPDADEFEPRTKAVLRRYVVERCLYGVDLDPLAIELCRLALWTETMDRDLPFTFLDHKIKCGNSLVGAWFDQFQHYPVMAWKNREGGDKGHTNGVHFEKEARGKAIKAFVKERLTPNVLDAVTGQFHLSRGTLEEPGRVHAEALDTLSMLHDLPVHDGAERARIYRDELIGSPQWRSLKTSMDLWCACWFWPADELKAAPFPTTLAAPSQQTRAIGEAVAAQKRFFHWELEFPDVFRVAGSGFDAVLGNPPWDIAKPNSKEFFSNIDPLYRSYGKQEALVYQSSYFADAEVERAWLDYNADFRASSNYMGNAAGPFGDPTVAGESSQRRFSIVKGKDNDALHRRWREARLRSAGYADRAHPFQHQGSADINLYKAFLEQAHALLRPDGRLGFIVPSGLYSDHGTGDLRRLFLDRCRWEWLFGFENRDGIFEIHRSFKFNPIIIQKGGSTTAIRTAFMRRKLEDWEGAEALVTPYTRAQVERFSPRSKAILEIQSPRDLEILERIYANSVLLGDDGPDGWGIKYATEFHMTNDSKLFPPRPKWEADGYRPDEYSRWLKGAWRPIAELWAALGVTLLASGERRCAQPPYDTLPVPRADIPVGIILSREADAWIKEDGVEGVALPLYAGRMIYLCNWAAAHVPSEVPGRLDLDPDFLLAAKDLRHNPATGARVVFRDIARTTDMRTFITALIPPLPCGNKLPLMEGERTLPLKLALATYASSLSFDWCTRARLCSTSLNWHVVESLALPGPTRFSSALVRVSARFHLTGWQFAPEWLQLNSCVDAARATPLTTSERFRHAVMLDAIAAATFGLTEKDLAHVLRDCDRPVGHSVGLESKGFWRIDKQSPPELRHTVLTIVAFHNLNEKISACSGDRDKGIEAFLTQNDGEGWMLPETLRLADYGLGYDERAQHPQPVAIRLGPRFYDWQLAQSAEESWRECHLHARNLLGETGYRALIRGGAVGRSEPGSSASVPSSATPPPAQHELFK